MKIISDSESGFTSLNAGTNEFQWKGKSLMYEVKEVQPGSGRSGLCHTIWPKNVLLEPGDAYKISIFSNITKKGCRIFL